MSLIEALNWRYATKRMNGEKVPQEKVDAILEAARLAPSSAGLQPFTIIEISNSELLEKIKPVANNQPQITEASHLLVFAAWDNITGEQIDKFFEQTRSERNLPEGSLDDYKNRIKSIFASRTPEQNFQSAARQAYISFGIAIAAAATEQVDATPMEGFNGPELDKLLGLNERGLRSVTLLPLGYRDEANDRLASLKKIRRPKAELIINL